MSNQEPLHTSGAVNGAVFRRPTIVKKINKPVTIECHSVIKETKNQINLNSKTSEA
jgi:hypothetical protein